MIEFRFGNYMPEGAAGIAIVQTKALKPEDSIHIVDRSIAVPENGRDYSQHEPTSQTAANWLNLESRDFLVTTKSKSIAGSVSIPLWYVWQSAGKIHNDPEDLPDESIFITDFYGTKVQNMDYNIEYYFGSTFEYTDGDATWHDDPPATSPTTHLYKFRIFTAFKSADDLIFKVVWNYYNVTTLETTYRESKFLNTEEWMEESTVASNERMYYITADAGGLTYTATFFDAVDTKWLQFQSRRKIYVETPVADTTDDPWYLRIRNGKFRRTIGGIVYEYQIPEYTSQWFDSGGDTIKITDKRAEFVSKNVIKVPHSRIVVVRNNNYVMTVSVKINGVLQSVGTVMDVEPENGLIQISEDLDYKDTVLVTYYYKEDYYTYTGYNQGAYWRPLEVNPTDTHNPNIRDHRIQIWIRPYKVNGVITNETVLYHKTDDDYSAPAWDVILASIQVTPTGRSERTHALDIRRRGGGLNFDKHTIEEFKHKQPESVMYWDVGKWDGEYFPAQGAIIIQLPNTLLDSYTEEEIEKATERHLAFGISYVIEYVTP